MSTPRESVVGQIIERYQLSIKHKLGVSAYYSIPRTYRPPGATLSYPLLAELSELAGHVSDLATFQKRLVQGRERRPIGTQVPWEDQFLQPRDVAAALEELEQEKAEGQSSEGAYAQQAIRGPDPVVIVTKPASEPRNGQSTSTSPLLARAYHKRSSKSAASSKIQAWTRRLKPTCKTSIIEMHAQNAIDDEDEDDLPIQRGRRQKAYRGTIGLSSNLSPFQTGASMKRSRHTSLSGSERTSTKPRLSNSGLSTSEGSGAPGSARQSRKTRRTSQKTLTSEDNRMLTQMEHELYFKLPPNQHFKTAKPTVIQDVRQIKDFNALRYPVEVPNPREKGTNYEFETPEELEEYARDIQSGHTISLARIATKGNTPLSLFPVGRSSSLQAKIEDSLERFSDDMLRLSAEAMRTPTGLTLDGREKDEVDKMRSIFLSNIRHAKVLYFNGLAQKGILDGHKNLEKDQGDSSYLGELKTSRQGPVKPVQGEIDDSVIIDLTVGHVDSDDE